jgi:hypothetical protein
MMSLERFDLPIAVVDFIIGTAATWAEVQLPALLHPRRFRPTEQAKRWIDGYLRWYDDPAHLAVRNSVAAQPDFGQMILDGSLLYARRHYRNIPWDAAMIASPRSLWNHRSVLDEFPNDMLGRVNMNMMNEVIEAWQTVWFQGLQLDMPLRVTRAGGGTLTLGVEIVLDWLMPPDPGHGHPMGTIRQLKGMAAPYNLRKDRDNSGSRKSYSILHGGEWIFVLDGPGQNTVITFYKRHI